MNIPHDMYIDGQWTGSSDDQRIDIINPAPLETIDSVPKATTSDLDGALAAADRGWRHWREVDAWTRSAKLRHIADWIRAHAQTIAEVLTDEQGKPVPEAKGEIMATADQFDWYADEARRIYGRVIDGHSRDHRMLVLRQPVGPVAAFSPWNFPALLSARKMAPAIAAGCSIIVKPAIEAPRATLMLAQACESAQLPAGVVNVVTGKSAQISEQLLRSPIIRKISLTGSVDVGKQVLHQAADQIKSITMELGGHSPVLVFEDADVEEAAATCAKGKFRNNGQVCIAASRFFVHESVVDRFTKTFVETAKAMRLGNGREEGVEIGPLANERRLVATESLVADAVSKGAAVACGGRRPDGHKNGYYYEPTVLTNVDDSMKLMHEEPFAPIAPITTFNDMENVLQQANDTELGLAGYIFTQNTKTAFHASEGLEVGMVGVNHLVIASAEMPFGGIKQSGFGREGGSEGIDYYTVTKYINLKL